MSKKIGEMAKEQDAEQRARFLRNAGIDLSVDDIDIDALTEELEDEPSEMLRDLFNKILDIKEKSERGEDCVAEVDSIIDQTNEVTSKVRSSSVAYLDAQILNFIGLILRNNSDIFGNSMNEYNSSEFATNLRPYLKSTPETESENKMDVLAKWARKIIKFPVITYSEQFGVFKGIPSESTPKVSQRRVREKFSTGPAVVPKTVNTVKAEEEDPEEHIGRIMKALEEREKATRQPVGVFELVVNPHSFPETIENIFHFSHVMKEGLVEVFDDEDGLKKVQIIKNADGSSVKRCKIVHTTYKRIVLTMDYQSWKEIIETCKIKEPLIPTRIKT